MTAVTGLIAGRAGCRMPEPDRERRPRFSELRAVCCASSVCRRSRAALRRRASSPACCERPWGWDAGMKMRSWVSSSEFKGQPRLPKSRK